MAWKYLVKHKHNYIQSNSVGKNQQRNKRRKKIKACLLLILETIRDSLSRIEKKNQFSIINKFMY